MFAISSLNEDQFLDFSRKITGNLFCYCKIVVLLRYYSIKLFFFTLRAIWTIKKLWYFNKKMKKWKKKIENVNTLLRFFPLISTHNCEIITLHKLYAMECARENILLQKNIYYQLLCCQRIEYFLINYLKILEEKNLEFYIFSIDFFFRIQIDFFFA